MDVFVFYAICMLLNHSQADTNFWSGDAEHIHKHEGFATPHSTREKGRDTNIIATLLYNGCVRVLAYIHIRSPLIHMNIGWRIKR